MVHMNCKIIFLFIVLCAIEKDITFAENTTSVVKTVETSTTSRPVTTSNKTSTTISAPVTSSNSVYEITTPSIITGTAESNGIVNNNEFTKLFPDFTLYDSDYEIKEETEPTPTVHVDVVKNFHYVTYNEQTGVPCILTKMGITLTVPYKTENNTIDTKTIKVPSDANVTGTCEESLSVLTIAWQETNYVEETFSVGENSLTMHFIKDGDIFYIQYLVVSIVLDELNFPNATDSVITGNSSLDLKLFPAPVYSGIHVCNEMKVQADPILVQIQNVSIIAFNNQTDFSSRQEAFCTSEENGQSKNMNIGIYVGVVLGGLLLIGLIIFTVKRSSGKATSWNLLRKSKDHEACQ